MFATSKCPLVLVLVNLLPWLMLLLRSLFYLFRWFLMIRIVVGSSRNLSSICTGHSITLATHGSRDMQLSNDTSNLDANISRDLFLAQQVHIADSLNDALLWCEDQLLTLTVPTYDMNNPFQYHHNTINTLPEYLQQIYALCPTDIPVEAIDRLLAKFMPREVSYGTILWRQGKRRRKHRQSLSNSHRNDLTILLVYFVLRTEREDYC